MTGYKKSVLKTDNKKKRVRITKFNAYMGIGNDGLGSDAGVLNAVESLNCDCADGGLRAGPGIRVCTDRVGRMIQVPTGAAEVTKIYPVVLKTENGYKETVSIITADGALCVYDDVEGTFKEKGYVTADAIAVTAMDGELEAKTVFMGEGGAVVYDSAGARFVGPEGVSNAGCICGNRLFMAVEPFSVAYSEALSVENFAVSIDDGGVIHFPTEFGKILSLIAVEEYVYIVYERGVSRLKSAGAAREFRLERLAYGGGSILAGSAANLGGVLVFLAEDGGYRVKGNKTERAWKKTLVLPLRGGQVCDHAVSEGKYLVRYIDENGWKRTAALDAEGESGFYIFDAPALSGGMGNAYCCFDGEICRIVKDGELPTGSAYRFVSEKTDFGVTGRKLLKSLRFKGTGSFRVNVDDGRKETVLSLIFSDSEAVADVFLRGEAFTMTFFLDKDTKIAELVAELEYLA